MEQYRRGLLQLLMFLLLLNNVAFCLVLLKIVIVGKINVLLSMLFLLDFRYSLTVLIVGVVIDNTVAILGVVTSL